VLALNRWLIGGWRQRRRFDAQRQHRHTAGGVTFTARAAELRSEIPLISRLRSIARSTSSSTFRGRAERIQPVRPRVNRPFTMVIWVKDTETGSVLLAKQENTGNFRGIASPLTAAPTAWSPWLGGFAIQINSATNTSIRVSTNVAVNDGAWHFLAATYDGSGLAAASDSTSMDRRHSEHNVRNTLNSTTIVNNVPGTIGSREGGASPPMAFR